MDFAHPMFGEWPSTMYRRSFPSEMPSPVYQQSRRPWSVPVLATQPIPYECRRHGNNLVILFDLPGVRGEDIEVSCREGLLKVKATKMVETFRPPYRGTVPLLASMQLPKGLGSGRVEHAGQRLAVTFPMRQERAPKRARMESDADAGSERTCDSYGTGVEAEGPMPSPRADPLSEAESSEQAQPQPQHETQLDEKAAPYSEAPPDGPEAVDEESEDGAAGPETVGEEGDTVMHDAELADDTEMTDEQRQLIAASQAKLDAVAENVAAVVREHEEVAFRRTAAPEATVDKARKYYNELLLLETLKLDQVESHGDTAIRQRRKQMVGTVQGLQERLDELIAAEKSSST